MTGRKGFTLLEILIAISILAIVLIIVFSCYTGSLTLMKDVQYRSDVHARARIALTQMIEDLESACIIGDKQFFTGKADEINNQNSGTFSFCSSAYPVFGYEDKHAGGAVIAYSIINKSRENTFNLYRSELPWFEEANHEKTRRLLLCDGLTSLAFTYYDSFGESHEYWDSADGPFRSNLPRRVSVSLEFANRIEPGSPFRFWTCVSIPATGGNREKVF